MQVVSSPSYVFKIVNSEKAFKLPYSERERFSRISPYLDLSKTQSPARKNPCKKSLQKDFFLRWTQIKKRQQQ